MIAVLQAAAIVITRLWIFPGPSICELIMEAYSNHLDNQITFNVPAGAVLHRLYGPFYLHFNSPSSGDGKCLNHFIGRLWMRWKI